MRSNAVTNGGCGTIDLTEGSGWLCGVVWMLG